MCKQSYVPSFFLKICPKRMHNYKPSDRPDYRTTAGFRGKEFYAALEGLVVVAIEATGAMQWFLELLEELRSNRVGHPAKIRAA